MIYQNVGRMEGTVICKNWRIFPAPSIWAASNNEGDTCWIAVTYIIVEIPKLLHIDINEITNIVSPGVFIKLIFPNPIDCKAAVIKPIFECKIILHIIPITVAEQIRTNGKVSHPVIGISGVSLNDYSSYELQRYGVKVSVDEGIYVVKVTSDGAASKAGIQQGDVIVKLDGKDITTYKSFLTALYSHKAGDKVKVVVNRSGTEKTIEVTLQEK